MMSYLRVLFLVLLGVFASFSNVNAQGMTNLDIARQYESTGEFDKAVVYYEKQYAIDPFNTYEPYHRRCALRC
ncbi:MAG: hypothetical protein IPJ79_13305 [Bacteroidetes bacterium]|nr:hypothetical protein [Bacteroidota bacterium]